MLSALKDKILIGIDEAVFTVKKGGTAYITPFADESRQRVFILLQLRRRISQERALFMKWRKYE